MSIFPTKKVFENKPGSTKLFLHIPFFPKGNPIESIWTKDVSSADVYTIFYQKFCPLNISDENDVCEYVDVCITPIEGQVT